MAKRIQVGGRIESKEVGGIVTGAAEILDDAKGKKQSVINQETDDELVRLEQSKQDNLTFDNAPTEGSDNPVKSGGLYTAQQAILLAIAAINELIPSAASALNQLADKAFVNSSISTNTATFRGTSAAGLNEQQFLAWANGLTHDLNDYVFWQTSDAAGNTLFKRYKWNGTEWAYEYTLNNSTFTAEQWEAIQSGITALLVTKLRALPTAQELIQSFDSKQDVLTFDNVPTLGSNNPVKSSGIYNVIKAITDLIPAEATEQNQLADKADVAAKIVAAIPSWKGQYDALIDLQAVTGTKAGDMGCVKTTDSDGYAVLTFYQYSAQGAWVVYYTLRHYAQNKPATTGTTGDYPYNGMGRIELQKNIVNGVNTLTQAMFTQQNTIYVIQYDFTLGEDITIPANCALEFDGGSITGATNCTLTMNDCYLQGLPKFNNVVFAGDIKNDIFDCTWIVNGSDLGAKLNYAQTYFKRLYSPKGTYNLDTPILLTGMDKVVIESDFNYTGPIVNDGYAIAIEKTGSREIYVFGVTISEGRLSHANDRTINFVGIKFGGCSNCIFHVNRVAYFNENIRFEDKYGEAGCDYNRLYCLSNISANMCVRFYSYNGGWSNETAIIGGNFTKYGTAETYGTTYGVFIGGPADDNPSYAVPGRTASYDAHSHITIQDTSMEHLDYIVHTRNTTGVSVIRCREEDVKSGLLEAVGYCRLFNYVPGYTDISNRINADRCSDLTMNFPYEYILDANRDLPQCAVDSVLVTGATNIHAKSINDYYLAQKGVIIDTTDNKIFVISVGSGGTILKMLNDDGTSLLPMTGDDAVVPVNGASYNSAQVGFSWKTTFVIPQNVKRIFLGVLLSNSESIDTLTISSNKPLKIITDNFTKGAFSDKPSKMQQGLGYYCTDRNKLIYYNNTDNKWYDAAGNEQT